MNYFVLFVASIQVRFTIMISNTELKRLTSLRQGKYRKLHGQYLLEGVRLLEEALSAGVKISKLWHQPEDEQNDLQKSLILSAVQKGIPTEETTADTLLKLSDTVHHQGVIGVASLPKPAELGSSRGESLLYLEEISDPGNLGTILRTAWWFGIKHIALSLQCVDPYNPKVVRAGMGAHFNLSIYTRANLKELTKLGHEIVAADQNGEPLKSLKKISGPFCLVMGSEAHGVSEKSQALADKIISIPGNSGADSLNVAVAAGILLFTLFDKP